jgi:hypothetical protein
VCFGKCRRHESQRRYKSGIDGALQGGGRLILKWLWRLCGKGEAWNQSRRIYRRFLDRLALLLPVHDRSSSYQYRSWSDLAYDQFRIRDYFPVQVRIIVTQRAEDIGFVYLFQIVIIFAREPQLQNALRNTIDVSKSYVKAAPFIYFHPELSTRCRCIVPRHLCRISLSWSDTSLLIFIPVLEPGVCFCIISTL